MPPSVAEAVVTKFGQFEVLIRQIGVMEQTFFRWKGKLGEMGPDQLKN